MIFFLKFFLCLYFNIVNTINRITQFDFLPPLAGRTVGKKNLLPKCAISIESHQPLNYLLTRNSLKKDWGKWKYFHHLLHQSANQHILVCKFTQPFESPTTTVYNPDYKTCTIDWYLGIFTAQVAIDRNKQA